MLRTPGGPGRPASASIVTRRAPIMNHDTRVDRRTLARDRPRALALLRRLGAAGFLFFFLKGVAWLVVPAVLWALQG